MKEVFALSIRKSTVVGIRWQKVLWDGKTKDINKEFVGLEVRARKLDGLLIEYKKTQPSLPLSTCIPGPQAFATLSPPPSLPLSLSPSLFPNFIPSPWTFGEHPTFVNWRFVLGKFWKFLKYTFSSLFADYISNGLVVFSSFHPSSFLSFISYFANPIWEDIALWLNKGMCYSRKLVNPWPLPPLYIYQQVSAVQLSPVTRPNFTEFGKELSLFYPASQEVWKQHLLFNSLHYTLLKVLNRSNTSIWERHHTLFLHTLGTNLFQFYLRHFILEDLHIYLISLPFTQRTILNSLVLAS